MPDMTVRNCHTCGEPVDPVLVEQGMFNHPTCDQVPQDIELTSPPAAETLATVAPLALSSVDPKVSGCPEPQVAKAVKDELTTMIVWAESNRPRSLQVTLGPSELGGACDRELAYKIMGLRGPNLDMADPWPAFVGSAIHTRTEDSIRAYQDAHPLAPRWNIEHLVKADPLIQGHADLWRVPLVVDVKSAGKTVLTQVRKEGPPLKYKIQANVYVKGLRDAGHPVDFWVLAFVPREGLLKDMFTWAERYDEAMALEYLARPYNLRDLLVRLDVPNNPGRWNQVPAAPSYMGCQYCTMWERYAGPGVGADDKACPGYQPGKK